MATDVELLRFEDDGRIPNNPTLPAVVAAGRLDVPVDAGEIEARLREDHWDGTWVDGVFPFHHYHSTAHELLCVLRGEALIMLGGERGREVPVSAGDVLVLPAGTGHRRLSSSSGFQVLGAYPRGQTWDLLRGEPSERPWALENIRRVPLPEADPLDIPVLRHWHLE